MMIHFRRSEVPILTAPSILAQVAAQTHNALNRLAKANS